MKSIVLYTARTDNGGQRRASGEELTVGTKDREIDKAVASDLVKRQLAAPASRAETSEPESA